MNLLLDTHSFIWTVCDTGRLPAAVREALQEKANSVVVSAVTFWEISLKFALHKLELHGNAPRGLVEAALQMGFEPLPLTPKVAAEFHGLPRIGHKDPFDRMLVWQAIQGGYHFVSCDEELKAYVPHGLKLYWPES